MLENIKKIVFLFALTSSSLFALEKNIDLNTKVDGKWTTDSVRSEITKHRTEYYKFTLTETKEVMIKLDSLYEHRINLLTSNYELIEEDFGDKSAYVWSLNPGTYILDISNMSDEFGFNLRLFTLTLRENFLPSKSISLNSVVDGEWTKNSGFSELTSYPAEQYTFTLDSRTDVAITLRSNGTDGGRNKVVRLMNNQGGIIYTGEYYGSGILKTLDTGTYVIEVTNNYGYNNSEYTSFRLSLKEHIITPAIPISLNSTLDSQMTMNSMFAEQYRNSSDAALSEHFEFTLSDKTNIAILVSGDAYIYIYDSNGEVIDSWASIIERTLDEGTYTIAIVKSFYSDLIFEPYSITLRKNIIYNTNIEVNTNVENVINHNSGVAYRRQVERFTFELTNKAQIYIVGDTISLFDNEGKNIARAYDSGMNFVPIEIILKPGIYVIQVEKSNYFNSFYIKAKPIYDWLVPLLYNSLF